MGLLLMRLGTSNGNVVDRYNTGSSNAVTTLTHLRHRLNTNDETDVQLSVIAG
jgi:hypothetical protein